MSQANHIKAGLCSVTFRNLSIHEVVELATKAGISGIEWCADVHVPVGNLEIAKMAADLCWSQEISIPSYGSYVRAGVLDDRLHFDQALKTAVALCASNIRVWAGKRGSEEVSMAERKVITNSLNEFAKKSSDAGITMSVERHADTLTDTLSSGIKMLQEIDQPNCFVYWQPRPGDSALVSGAEVRALGERLSHLHVFHWLPGNIRRPLREATSFWREIITTAVPRSPDMDRYAFLEFTMNDDPKQFLDDSKILRRLVADCGFQRSGTRAAI